jgi:peptidyl-prolyl cis-trans isomerase C
MSNLFVSALSTPRRWTLAALVAAAMLAAGGAPAIAQTPPDPLVATVNGIEIHQSDLAMAEEELGGQLPQGNTEAKREYLVGILTNMVLLAQAAEERHVQDDPDFKRKLAFTRNKVLMETLLQGEVKKAMTDQALRAVYDEAIKQMPAEEEVHARHILFRVPDWNDAKQAAEAEAKAKAVVERLRKGEDFVKLANELTEDPSGKKDGGDLNYFTKDEMVPAFATVAFSLDKGKFSDPVKTQFGWHIILVEDKRKRPAPAFEQVKPQLERVVARKAQVDLVTKLRADAKIVRADKPAEPAQAPQTPAQQPTPPAPPAAPKK